MAKAQKARSEPTVGRGGSRGIIRTKLRPPRSNPGLIPRPQLIGRLQEPAPRVVLVSAPAGSGKTELAAEWLRKREGPGAWLSLDPQDQQPNRFFSHLSAAVLELNGREASALLDHVTADSIPTLDGWAGSEGTFMTKRKPGGGHPRPSHTPGHSSLLDAPGARGREKPRPSVNWTIRG